MNKRGKLYAYPNAILKPLSSNTLPLSVNHVASHLPQTRLILLIWLSTFAGLGITSLG